jgi:hypothetical protein
MYGEQEEHSTGWTDTLERNRDALLGLLAWLVSLLGLENGPPLPRLPRALHRAVLRLLTPAEAATRRLIVLAAQGLVVKPTASRATSPRSGTKQGRLSPPAFRLIDPKQRIIGPRRPLAKPRAEPRIHFFDVDPRISALPEWRVSQSPSLCPMA